MLAFSAGDGGRADRLSAQALAIYERTEDAPGMEGIPLNRGGLELDSNPELACVHLARSAEICRRRGRLYRTGSWAVLELAEALLAIGEPARAREALAEAFVEMGRYGDSRGLRHAEGVEQRLMAATGGELSGA
jgi:hypothetical protein